MAEQGWHRLTVALQSSPAPGANISAVIPRRADRVVARPLKTVVFLLTAHPRPMREESTDILGMGTDAVA